MSTEQKQIDTCQTHAVPEPLNASLQNAVWVNAWLGKWLDAHLKEGADTRIAAHVYSDGSRSLELLGSEGKATGGTLFFNRHGILHVLNPVDGRSYTWNELVRAADLAAQREIARRESLPRDASSVLAAAMGFIAGVLACGVLLALKH